MATEIIKDFYGRKLGTVTKSPNGDELVKDFYGRVVARYVKSQNVTKDFYGRIIAKGNVAVGLLYKDIK